MLLLISFIIAGVLMFAEYLLCTKFKSPLWGGIIPALILMGSIYAFTMNIIPLKTDSVFPYVIINILFFGDWATGRDKYKKIQQTELEKMKAQDIH